MRINRDDVIDTNHFQKIGDHPRHDRFPPTMPPVRAPVAETWHNRNAACRTGAAAGISQSEQFDQVIVGRWRGRLHQEDLFTTHTLQYLHGDFSIRKPFDDAVTDRSP